MKAVYLESIWKLEVVLDEIGPWENPWQWQRTEPFLVTEDLTGSSQDSEQS